MNLLEQAVSKEYLDMAYKQATAIVESWFKTANE
jgi:hypothetical protein